MHKVLAFLLNRINLVVVTTDSQNLSAVFVDGNNVRQLDTRRLAHLIRILEPVDVEITVHLQNGPDIVCVAP